MGILHRTGSCHTIITTMTKGINMLEMLSHGFMARALVAGLLAWGGQRMEAGLRTYVERIGWALVIIAIVAYLYLRN